MRYAGNTNAYMAYNMNYVIWVDGMNKKTHMHPLSYEREMKRTKKKC